MESSTLHEILSQPEIWKKTLHRAEHEHWRLPPAEHAKSSLLFVGCGTSFYLAQSAAASFVRLSGGPARAVPSSEVFLFAPTAIAPSEKPVAVAISRSGTTSETVWAAAFLRKQLRLPVLAVTCYADGALAGESNWQIIIPDAQEKSVVMTRSFTAQLLALLLASVPQGGAATNSLMPQLANLPARGEKLLADALPLVQALANDSALDHFVFLGQGIFYGAANEAMLKMKEMSLTYSEAYHTLEYRHGPMSIAGKRTLITLFMTDAGYEQEVRVLAEMKKLGARLLVFSGKDTEQVRAHADHVFALGEEVPEEGRLLLAIPIIQLLGYYRALSKGLNPDAPRHLSQVVTL